jgi:hypothetical protein
MQFQNNLTTCDQPTLQQERGLSTPDHDNDNDNGHSSVYFDADGKLLLLLKV